MLTSARVWKLPTRIAVREPPLRGSPASALAISEDVLANGLDLRRFLIGQWRELLPAAPLRQFAFALPDEQDQVLGQPVGHLHHLHDAPFRFVVAAQLIDPFRKIVFDRAGNAGIKKLGFSRAIEIPVEIDRIIGDLDIPVRRRSPLDE